MKNAAIVPGTKKDLIVGGIACGLFVVHCGQPLQQIGLMYKTAGKAGFTTS